MNEAPHSFRIQSSYVHLGLGAVAFELPGFEWTPDYLERYQHRTELDGQEGRLVSMSPHTADWKIWERHPSGDELVVVVSGRITLRQELDSGENVVVLGAGDAVINPRNVWHTADVHERGDALYVTPGLGTQHRLRD